MGQIWAGIAEFQLQAHGFGGNQNIRENDDCVDAEPEKWLDRDFEGQLGRLANLEECVLCADLTVFRKIPSRLAHHPDRDSRKYLSPAGAQE
jgi:hypothetical protein